MGLAIQLLVSKGFAVLIGYLLLSGAIAFSPQLQLIALIGVAIWLIK